MEIEKSYQLLDIVRDDGIRTHSAREIATGRPLAVHIFPGEGNPESRGLFEKLRGLPLSARRDLLEIGREGEAAYIVTDPLPAGTTARAWFSGMLKPAADAREQRVRAAVWQTGTPVPDPLFPPEPGEFTRMFQTPSEPRKETPAAPGPTRLFAVPEQAAPPKTSGPSEFTKFFQSPLQPVPLGADPFIAPKAAPPAPSSPGEFTQMFGSPSPAQGPAPPLGSSAPSTPVRPKAPAKGPGEYTQLMSASSSPMLGSPIVGQQAAKPESAKPRNSMLPVIVILGAALSLAILIVLFFALRHR